MAQDPATARPHLEVGRDAFAALGYPSPAAVSVLVLGNVAREGGDYPAAARLYAEAEALARPTGDTYVLGQLLWSRAELAHREGRQALPASCWRKGWRCGGRTATRGRSVTRWRGWDVWPWLRATQPPRGGG